MLQQVSKNNPVSIGNIEGYKYNYTNECLSKTQIAFAKDTRGFVISYYLGDTDQSKDNDVINIMVNSLKIN